MDRDPSTTGAMRGPHLCRAHVLTTRSVPPDGHLPTGRPAPTGAHLTDREQRTLLAREAATPPDQATREQRTLPARAEGSGVARGRARGRRTPPANGHPGQAAEPTRALPGCERPGLPAPATSPPEVSPGPTTPHRVPGSRHPLLPPEKPAASPLAKRRPGTVPGPLHATRRPPVSPAQAGRRDGGRLVRREHRARRQPGVAACGQVGTRHPGVFPGRAIPGILDGRGVSGDGQRTPPGPAMPTVMVPAVRLVRVTAGTARGRRERARAEVAG